MQPSVTRARALKQALLDFVFDAEGEIATALEAYTAQQLARPAKLPFQGANQTDLIIDRFATEEIVNDRLPLDYFLDTQPNLSPAERSLVRGWQNSFMGVFVVKQVLPTGVELMNWLTAKHYQIQTSDVEPNEPLAKLQANEILVTRIAPVTETDWMFSGPQMFLGKLGKPKLAVVIGNFKHDFPDQLYGDAPELRSQAWESVEQYYQKFIDFFGSNEVTLPGYQLNRKLQEFQDLAAKQKLAEAGIDENKSLQDVVAESGLSQAEILENAEALGVDAKVVEKLLKERSPASPSMVMSSLHLPEPLKQAEHLTMLVHPRWGQVFLTNYYQLKTLLETKHEVLPENASKLIKYYLTNPEVNIFVWQHLAQHYPVSLEALLREVLARPNFKLSKDLDTLLQEFHKSLEPELPEIASVPIHLHELFQEVVSEVSKEKAKAKEKTKASKGFQK
jgi:hypothetical protein